MKQADKILGAALRRMKDPEAARTWLAASWTTLAGSRIAAHSRPVALRNGIFEIAVDSAEWRRQVESMTSLLRERINHAWGGSLVQKIQVEAEIRRGRRIPYAEDNNHTPFIRRPHGREAV